MPHPAERPNSADLIRGRTTVGDFELTILTDGCYFLDGGAMFGVVPKPLWEKRAPADDREPHPPRTQHRHRPHRPAHHRHRNRNR